MSKTTWLRKRASDAEANEMPEKASHYRAAADEIDFLKSENERLKRAYLRYEFDAALANDALRRVYDALMSDPPHGPQKHVGPDDVIYQLDGQLMYHAINAARDALTKLNPSRAVSSASTDLNQ